MSKLEYKRGDILTILLEVKVDSVDEDDEVFPYTFQTQTCGNELLVEPDDYDVVEVIKKGQNK